MSGNRPARWHRSARSGPLIALRPIDGELAADGTQRLLWGTAAGGFVWWVFDAAGLSDPVLLAGLVAAAVAIAGMVGVGLAAVGSALALNGVDSPMRVAAAAVVVVAAAGALGPTGWIGRRCGALPIDQLCLTAALGVLAIGVPGGFLAPTGVALVRVVANGRSYARTMR